MEKIIEIQPCAPDSDGTQNERYRTASVIFHDTKGTFSVGDEIDANTYGK